LIHRIKDAHVGLTTASGEHTDAFGVLAQGIKGNLLVGAELDHVPHLRIGLL
jgi:hypothetical protein